MNLGFTVSEHVINTINALPLKERASISSALTAEFILGEDPRDQLTPFENMLYSIIRHYISRDNR